MARRSRLLGPLIAALAASGIACSHDGADLQRQHDAEQRAQIDACVRERLAKHIPQPTRDGTIDLPTVEFLCATDASDVEFVPRNGESYRCTSFRGFKYPVTVRIAKRQGRVDLLAEQLERRDHFEGAYGSASSAGFRSNRWTEFVGPLECTSRASSVREWFLEHLTPLGYVATGSSSAAVDDFCMGLLRVAQIDPDQIRRPRFTDVQPGADDLEQ